MVVPMAKIPKKGLSCIQDATQPAKGVNWLTKGAPPRVDKGKSRFWSFTGSHRSLRSEKRFCSVRLHWKALIPYFSKILSKSRNLTWKTPKKYLKI